MSDTTVLRLGPAPGDDLYLTLGRTIAAQCAPGFAEARLEAELAEDGGDFKLHCTPEGEAERTVDVEPVARVRIIQLLAQIRDRTDADDGRRWRSCEVVLRKGGRFEMDVHY